RYWTDDARSAGNTVGIRSGCQCRVQSDDAHPGTGKIRPPASRTLNMPRLTLPKKRPVKHATSSPTLYASPRLRPPLSTVQSSVFVNGTRTVRPIEYWAAIWKPQAALGQGVELPA